MFSVSGSMLAIYVTSPQKQVTDVSLVLKDSDTESENLSSLVRLSVSDGQKTDSLNVVSFIGISRIPDRDFRYFYPCKKFLSHTPGTCRTSPRER